MLRFPADAVPPAPPAATTLPVEVAVPTAPPEPPPAEQCDPNDEVPPAVPAVGVAAPPPPPAPTVTASVAPASEARIVFREYPPPPPPAEAALSLAPVAVVPPDPPPPATSSMDTYWQFAGLVHVPLPGNTATDVGMPVNPPAGTPGTVTMTSPAPPAATLTPGPWKSMRLTPDRTTVFSSCTSRFGVAGRASSTYGL